MASKYALSIGVNKYPGTDADLSGYVNDSNDWKKVLKSAGFTVSQLLDEQATGKNIRDGIMSLTEKTNKGDSIIIQFSGHGTQVRDIGGDEADGSDECICPCDIMTTGEPIIDDELGKMFAAFDKSVKLVFISDSCNSGTVSKFFSITTPPTTKAKFSPIRKVRFLPPATFLSKKEVQKFKAKRFLTASEPGNGDSLLLAACQDIEQSWDGWFQGRANGVFTYIALKSLQRLPESATYRDWFLEILKQLPTQQYNQTPILYGNEEIKDWQILS